MIIRLNKNPIQLDIFSNLKYNLIFKIIESFIHIS